MPEVPEEILDLLEMVRKQEDLTEEQKDTLFSFLSSRINNIKKLVMEEIEPGYTERDYKRLVQAKRRHGEYQQTAKALEDPKQKLRSEESGDFADYITDQWNQARSIGLKAIQKWMNRASELGYYDKDTDRVEMGRFVEDALKFYVTQATRVEELEQEAVAGDVVRSIMADYIKMQRSRMVKVSVLLNRIVSQSPEAEELLEPALRLLPSPKGGEKVAGRESR